MDPTASQHLGTLRDPIQMQAILQRRLLPAATPGYAVESCAVDFVRQASNRCLAQYTLQLREPGTDTLRSQMVTGVTYDENRGLRILKRIHRDDPGAMKPSATRALPAITYIPELEMLIQVFPYDHRLPALAALMTDPPPELAATLLAELGPGDWGIETWEAETLRYRVDMRAMVRLAVQAREAASGRAAQRRVYAKIYRDAEEGERGAALQQAMWAHTSAAAPFRVARPIAYRDELRTLLLDEVTGITLLNILRRENEALPAVRRVARAVAALHLLPIDDVVAARERPPRDELARLDDLAATIQATAPELRETVADIVRFIAAAFQDVPSAPTHFDLKPAHFLLDGDRVTILDFDKLVAADPLVDVTGLLAHFRKERRESQRRQEGRTDAITRAFAEEYFAHVPAAWAARFPACQAMALLLEAASSEPGRHGRKGKARIPNRIETLVREAHEAAMVQRA